MAEPLALYAAGAGVVVGHNWPLYFRFKGGKGALTAATVMFIIYWELSLICLGVFLAIVALTRYVSLGKISAVAIFAALSFLPAFERTFYFQIFAFLLALIIILKHRENIQRLLSRTENKLTFRSLR